MAAAAAATKVKKHADTLLFMWTQAAAARLHMIVDTCLPFFVCCWCCRCEYLAIFRCCCHYEKLPVYENSIRCLRIVCALCCWMRWNTHRNKWFAATFNAVTFINLMQRVSHSLLYTMQKCFMVVKVRRQRQMYTMCFCTNLKENPQFIVGQKHLDNQMSEDEISLNLKENTARHCSTELLLNR